MVEAARELRQQFAAGLGELESPGSAVKKRRVEIGLQGLDLVAYCRRRDVQFIRGGDEAASAGGGLKRPQRVQGRQAHGSETSRVRKNNSNAEKYPLATCLVIVHDTLPCQTPVRKIDMSATTTKLHHARRASVFHPSMLELVDLVGTWLSRARQRRDLAKLTAEHLAD